MIAGILIIGRQAIFADDSIEPAEWVMYKAGQITLVCYPDINLKKLEARLRSRYFYVPMEERKEFTNPSYETDKRIMARLWAIFRRTKEILAMEPRSVNIKIKVFRNRNELSDEYSRIFNTSQHYKSFYLHTLGTIYTSMQDISDSVISHEMSHVIIDNYFVIIPPPRVAELLATYVDSHLEKE